MLPTPSVLTAHLGQFAGQFLGAIGLVALSRSIPTEPAAAFALLGFFTTLTSISIYAAVLGVDGVAMKFVADAWVNASDAEKGVTFRVAEAVRRIEIVPWAINLSSVSGIVVLVWALLAGILMGRRAVKLRTTGGGLTTGVQPSWLVVHLGCACSHEDLLEVPAKTRGVSVAV